MNISIYGAKGGHGASALTCALAISQDGQVINTGSTPFDIEWICGTDELEHRSRDLCFIDCGYLGLNEMPQGPSIIVVRGPDYPGLRSLQWADLDDSAYGLVLVLHDSFPRALRMADVLPLLPKNFTAMSLPMTADIARAIDAGLMMTSKHVTDYGNRVWDQFAIAHEATLR